MIRSCPVLVQRIMRPEHIGRDEYYFAGHDIIDGKEYSQACCPSDILTLADVKLKERRVVCVYSSRYVTLRALLSLIRDRKRHLSRLGL